MAEQLVNEFTVNRPIDEAWAVIAHRGFGMDLADERFARARMPRLRPNVRYSRSGHEYSFALR